MGERETRKKSTSPPCDMKISEYGLKRNEKEEPIGWTGDNTMEVLHQVSKCCLEDAGREIPVGGA